MVRAKPWRNHSSESRAHCDIGRKGKLPQPAWRSLSQAQMQTLRRLSAGSRLETSC